MNCFHFEKGKINLTCQELPDPPSLEYTVSGMLLLAANGIDSSKLKSLSSF